MGSRVPAAHPHPEIPKVPPPPSGTKPHIFVFTLSQFLGPDFPGAWNKLILHMLSDCALTLQEVLHSLEYYGK